MIVATADLFDSHGEELQVGSPIFRDYGGRRIFCGAIATVKVFEDNTLVRGLLQQPGEGRVLVVDGGGSLRCALVGDQLAQMAIDNGWSGLVVYGCIRDAAVIAKLDIGLKALNTNPAQSIKRGEGQEGIAVRFADTTFRPGGYLYADIDGIVLSNCPLN